MASSVSTFGNGAQGRRRPATAFTSFPPALPLLRVRLNPQHLSALLRSFEFCKAFDSHGPGDPAQAMSLLRFAVQHELQQRGYEFRPAGADLRIDCVVFARHAGVHTLGTMSVSIVALPAGRPILEAFAQARISDLALARPERTINLLAAHFFSGFPALSELSR